MIIFRAKSVLKKILHNYFIGSKNSVAEKKFMQLLSCYKIKWQAFNKKVVLAAVVEDYALCIKIAATSNLIAKKNEANIGLYTVATQVEDKEYKNNAIWKTIYSEIRYSRLDNIFFAFGGKLLYRNVYNKKSIIIDQLFTVIKNSIHTKEDVLAISIDGLSFGDLIYDTYLRMGNKPSINIQDPFLYHIIRQSLHIYHGFKELFEKYEVKAIVNSYTAYIHFGINIRLGLKLGIPVYTVGSYNNLLHKVQPTYYSHHNNHFAFKYLFNKLDNKLEKINTAKSIFEKRFIGVIDTATSYMKVSAFNTTYNSKLDKINWKKTIVVLAHCFFDSPHIYRDLLFPDFYEWIVFTLDKLSSLEGITVLVKPHPNGVAGNDEVFELLKKKYSNSNIEFIDKHTSNLQLFNARPKAIVTAYGTAASEFAYQGIPVLSIYDNPFTAYNFTKIAYSKSEYETLLNNIETLEVNIIKEEILEYYYMQHIYFAADTDADWLHFNKYKGATFSDEFLIDYMPQMNASFFANLDSVIQKGYFIAEKQYVDVLEII